MKRTTLTRRLLAGATALTIGTAAALAFASPAVAQIEVPPGENPTIIDYQDDCDGTTVTFGKEQGDYHWRVLVGAEVVWGGDLESDDPLTSGLVLDGEVGEVIVPAGPEPIDPQWWDATVEEWVSDQEPHVWSEPDNCQPLPQIDRVTIASCDFFVFVVRNDSEQGDIQVTLTPGQDVVHGHAPAFIPLLDQEPDDDGLIEIPDDAELVNAESIDGGDPVGPLGPVSPGEAHAHGFQAAEGLTVHLVIAHEAETVVDEEISWDDSAEGLDCPPPGDGGKGGDDDQGGDDDGDGGDDQGKGTLPTTGTPTLLIAGLGLALVFLGGVLMFVTRGRAEEDEPAPDPSATAG